MSDKPAVKTTDQSSSKAPITAQAPIYQDIWGKTAGAIDNFNPYGGNVVAGANPFQTQGATSIATAPVGTNAAPTADMAHKVASGYFLDPSNDPTFAGAVNSALTPITRQLTDQVLPSIVDKSIRAGGTGGGPGAYGGASQSLEQENAVRNWTESAANTTASMANASRNAGLNLIPQIPSLNAGANAEALAPGQASVAGGSLLQGYDQNTLDNELQKWNLSQNSILPFLQQAGSVLGMGGFGDTTGKTTETGSAPSVLAQWLQGLSGGAGVVGSLFGAPKGGTSAASGMASAASSILPMIASLSDRRVKRDIMPVGKTFDGQIIYRFRYGSLPTFHMGLMAQEVDKITPDAVINQDGVLLVDYKLATDVAAEMGA